MFEKWTQKSQQFLVSYQTYYQDLDFYYGIYKIYFLLHQQLVNNLTVWAQTHWAVSSIPPTSMSFSKTLITGLEILEIIEKIATHKQYSLKPSSFTTKDYSNTVDPPLDATSSTVAYFIHSHTAKYANRIGLSIIRLHNPYNLLHIVLHTFQI